MKNPMKAFAVVFVLFFLMCSCMSAEQETVPEYDTGAGGNADLKGAVINWGWSNLNNSDNTFGFLNGTALADTAAKRQKDVENAFNCRINVIYTDGDTNHNVVQTAALSGESIYDIAMGNSYTYVLDVRAGYFVGLSGLIDVSDTDKWGPPNMIHPMIWKNDVYGVVPYAWPELLYTTIGYPIVVNETIVSQYGFSDPREYVENNTWDWDRFEEVLHDYTIQESGRTIYGMATHSPYFSIMMFLSNGTSLSDYVDGKVVCGPYTEAGFAALDRAQKIYLETCRDCFHPSDAWGGVGVDLFVNGDITMLTLPSNELFGSSSSVLYRIDNVGLLPYPLGPDATPGVYRSDYSSLSFATAIPITARDFEVSAMILDAVYEPFDEFKTKEDIISYMAQQVFFDERDARIYANMLENTEYGYFREGARGVIETVCSSGTPVRQLLESNESKYEEIIEDYMNYHYQGIIAVYGEPDS